MGSTMKAVVFHGKNDLRFEDVPIPDVKKGQVKVCKQREDSTRGAALRFFKLRFDPHGAGSVEQACH
jgi:threonine dehydrogenase-like Zn-dependent dehydrogenase